MTLEPLPGDVVAGRDLLKLSPQILVLDSLAVGRAPVVGFPVWQPFGNALTQILGIGEERDVAGIFDGRERRDGGLEFHAIVGGGRLPASQLAHAIAVSKQCRPTARPGISITSAVSVDRYFSWTAQLSLAKIRLHFSLISKAWKNAASATNSFRYLDSA